MKLSHLMPTALAAFACAAREWPGTPKISICEYGKSVAPRNGNHNPLFDRMRGRMHDQDVQQCHAATLRFTTRLDKTIDRGYFPEKPGLEEAFAYACMQDPDAYRFANTLLDKIDAILEKMVDPDAAASEDGTSKPGRRHWEIYQHGIGKGTEEVGTSGDDPWRVKQVIEANHPSEGVSLREKMYLLHSIMVWVPQEMQRRAGVEPYKSRAEMKAREASMTDREIQSRDEKLKKYVASLGLDFPVSISALSRFSLWRRNSLTIEKFQKIQEEPPMTGIGTNTKYFEPRDAVRGGSPWVRNQNGRQNRTVDLAQWDPAYVRQAEEGTLDKYTPAYETMSTTLLNGTCYYVVNEDDEWARKNKANGNLVTMTGPSGTADFFIALMNVFDMTAEEKMAGVKALIGHMHVDNHHSVHEVMVATEGDRQLDDRIRYDGTRKALKRSFPATYAQAVKLQPQFVAREVALRNRLHAEAEAVFPKPGPSIEELD
jgi:hypothetical protein